jgi:hypothetical protein
MSKEHIFALILFSYISIQCFLIQSPLTFMIALISFFVFNLFVVIVLIENEMNIRSKRSC